MVKRQSLRDWRESVGLTQLELAHAVKAQPSQISNYERGKAVPEYGTVLALVDALRAAGAAIGSVEQVEFAALSAARNSDSAA